MLVQVFYRLDINKISTVCICSISKEIFRIEVPLEDWLNWKYGTKSSHEAFPYLTPDEREMIQTGTTPKEWNAWFKPSDEP